MHRGWLLVAFCLFVFGRALGIGNILPRDPSHGKLTVHVVPHCHADPGWWFSFEHYYDLWTRGIISSVISALEENPDRKFIWAEISFFSLWWEEQDDKKKESVLQLLKEKRLEIVGGGWVVPDEALITEEEMINSMTVGHEWIRENLGSEFIPKVGWAIDPFGHSSAIARSLLKCGMKATVINRILYSRKDELRKTKELEFNWRFPGEDVQNDFILTHDLVFGYYDIPNTCGISWDTCATYDFERDVSVPITDSNVGSRAKTLVNQYWEKAKFFRHSHLLVPLGDDFKYKTLSDATTMFENYEKLFKEINSNPGYNIKIGWSTLSEYFAAVKDYSISMPFPVKYGEFFPYADFPNQYWSGYYATRSHLKSWLRETEAIFRNVEAMLVGVRLRASSLKLSGNFEGSWIENCRKDLALLLHHDAITGTCRLEPAEDYLARLKTCFAQSAKAAKAIVNYILTDQYERRKDLLPILLHEVEPNQAIELPFTIVVHHPLDSPPSPFDYPSYLVRVPITSSKVAILDENNREIPSQVETWNNSTVLSFLCNIQNRSTSHRFFLIPVHRGLKGAVEATVMKGAHTISNQFVNTHFDQQYGVLTRIEDKKSKESMVVKVEPIIYTEGIPNGAYVMGPLDWKWDSGFQRAEVVTVAGPICSHVSISGLHLQAPFLQFTLIHDPFGQNPLNMIHIELHHSMMTKQTLTLRFTLDKMVDKEQQLWTDANGAWMALRPTNLEEPASANFFAATKATSFLNKEEGTGFHLLVERAVGSGLTGDGRCMEILVDRRPNDDDQKGMGENIDDFEAGVFRAHLVPSFPTATHLPIDVLRSLLSFGQFFDSRPLTFLFLNPLPPPPPRHYDSDSPGDYWGDFKSSHVKSAFVRRSECHDIVLRTFLPQPDLESQCGVLPVSDSLNPSSSMTVGSRTYLITPCGITEAAPIWEDPTHSTEATSVAPWAPPPFELSSSKRKNLKRRESLHWFFLIPFLCSCIFLIMVFSLLCRRTLRSMFRHYITGNSSLRKRNPPRKSHRKVQTA